MDPVCPDTASCFASDQSGRLADRGGGCGASLPPGEGSGAIATGFDETLDEDDQ